MFNNVVVGLKEGLDAGPLLDLVRHITAESAKIHLVTLVRVGAKDDELKRLTQAERELRIHATQLRKSGYGASSEAGFIVAGAAMDLLSIAKKRETELIVIGLAKRSRVGKALIGSDAQRVLLGAHCPVLVTHMY